MRLSILWGATAVLIATVACSEDTTSGTNSSGTGGAGASSTSGTGGAGASSTSGTGGAGASSTSGTGGAGGGCASDCAQSGLSCCGGICVNIHNDINNCGGCDQGCNGKLHFCDNGTCGTAPCDPNTVCSDSQHCCGSECCAADQICCVVPGGPQGPPKCVAPNDQGTCDPGCPLCP